MPAKHSRHIALAETLAARADSQVAEGACASTRDLVRTAIRILRSRDAGETSSLAARGAPASLRRRRG
ncbi:type II toxin-antitoxin system ParD family antitoxin [Methylobacterium sp. J-092]|uniref:type II toxin-antitoxin system ParD family antitoxin n=1 Tax=Methylobacterium sp. J-092 TaxID=2836667 RepID=UPI001FBBD6FF|nr:type II toxin-antitoxin system ParD family antitoxin [Methylobacterium sp. J-092]MCJ2010839.1 type II toxin-antitoxin system ParD family antitoxin [Methylobacterium sp. J-092]